MLAFVKGEQMTFSEWLRRNGVTQAEAARQLRVTRGHVNDLTNSRFWPSWAIATRIYDLTGGKVTPNDFFQSRRHFLDERPSAIAAASGGRTES
jgi:transcriptional regulator with XRE-family HTH domain